MSKTAEQILKAKNEYTIPCLYNFYNDPPVLAKGEMQYLFDTGGNKYLDCYSGVTVMNCGHCNPEITGPVIEQIQTLQHTTTIYLTEQYYGCARALVEFLDCSLKKVFFVNSGSEANEGALLLAKLFTGKNGFISLNGGLHGRTSLTMQLTGIDMWRTEPEEKVNLYKAPCPNCLDCELELCCDSCNLACADKIGEIIQNSGEVAAVIAEPIQGNGGIIVPPEGYFKRLREICDRNEVLLILDEVQSGFGRTGDKFAFQYEGIEPDILVVAKALGNGFPIAAFCTNDKIAACYTRPGASTTGGNPVSATAAMSVMKYLETHSLAEKSRSLGAFLKEKLLYLKNAFSFIRDVRGRGLMLGIEICSDKNNAAERTDFVLEELKIRGFLVGKTGSGRNVVTIMPPLVVEKQDLEALYTSLKLVFSDVERSGL